MLRYIAIRLALWVPSVLIVLLGVYALAFYGAGDPIKLIFLRAPGDVAYDPERIEAIRAVAGLDQPFFVQFGRYIGNLLTGNFGNSLSNGRPVWQMIAAAAPVSLQLGLISILLTAIVAVPLGVLAGINQNSRLDYTILGTALFLWAIPAYVAGPLLMVALITVLPAASVPYGWGGLFDVRIILPLLVLSFQPVALVVRQTRAAVIEVLSEDFVRTARAKGVSPFFLTTRHVLRNALIPITTMAGMHFGGMLGGAVVVETVYSWPGLGRLAFEAVMARDFSVLLGILLLSSFLVIVANAAVDLLQAWIDPRIGASR